MIYEARPNVTADAAALCIKAGNGIILRGGSEAIRSNIAIATALQRALRLASLPETALILVQDMARHTMLELLQLSDLIDLVIPVAAKALSASLPNMHASPSLNITKASAISLSMPQPTSRWQYVC